MENSTIQILQFGTGNFLRAFIEPMVQDIYNPLKPLNICMIQTTKGNTLEGLRKQNFQYHVAVAGIKDGIKVEEIQKINCIRDGLSLPVEAERFLDFASSPDVKWIISNVTEAGMIWKNEGQFTEFAESFAGRLTQWLYRRFQTLPHVQTIILPCELLPKNGDILKDFVLKHAEHWQLPLEFKHWIGKQCKFFNSLVDRIVPGFPSHLDFKEKENDAFVVQTEPYCFWAIEGDESDRNLLPFINSKAEVVLSHSIDYYSLRKIRILNGLHTYMASKGLMEGFYTVGEFVQKEKNLSELQQLLETEIFPCLPGPKDELQRYANQVLDRFRNPFVSHKLADISLNSIAKFKSRLAPIFDYHIQKSGSFPPIATDGLVSLILFYLNHPDKTKDTEEVKNYFSSLQDSQDEFVNVTKATKDLFGIEDENSVQNAYKKMRKTR
ncbi:MAG: tagaturonate reductase [Algoriphagus sp.]|jgi:tagaturonate reductase|nr:tagaturonate reductase [Algoriphagus sp.]